MNSDTELKLKDVKTIAELAVSCALLIMVSEVSFHAKGRAPVVQKYDGSALLWLKVGKYWEAGFPVQKYG